MSRTRGASRQPESLMRFFTPSGAPQAVQDVAPVAFCKRHHSHSSRSNGFMPRFPFSLVKLFRADSPRKRAASEQVEQRFSGKEFHDRETDALLGAHIKDGDQVEMR